MPTINIKRSFYYQTRKPTDSYNYTISYLSYPVICTDGTMKLIKFDTHGLSLDTKKYQQLIILEAKNVIFKISLKLLTNEYDNASQKWRTN